MTDRTLCFVLRALCMCAVGLLSFAAFGTVIRVAPGGAGDGGSWATAMALETALAEAQAGDEIRVRAGVYPVTLAGGFAVGRAVTVAGGYLGDDAQDEALADEATGEMRKTVGKRSTAVDAGDPASPYALEPDPNGSRVNLGAYGNTPWATFSPYGMKIFVK